MGEEGMQKLFAAKVLLFGTGGVGSYVFESLVRSGVGIIGVVDGDTVSETDLNRQLIATEKTLGMRKCDAAMLRAREIGGMSRIVAYPFYYTAESAGAVPIDKYDYVVDAIDDVDAKVDIIRRAIACGVPIVSVMGTGNKTDPSKLILSDISKTEVCPLARAVRVKLRKAGIVSGVKVVFSRERPRVFGGKIGSTAYVPATAGMIAASEVVRGLCQEN